MIHLLEITEPSPPMYLLTIVFLIAITPLAGYVGYVVFKKLNRNDKERG
jgi:hypothetical protein